MDIPNREHTRLARLKEVGPLLTTGHEILVWDIASGEQEAVLVHRDLAAQPVGVR